MYFFRPFFLIMLYPAIAESKTTSLGYIMMRNKGSHVVECIYRLYVFKSFRRKLIATVGYATPLRIPLIYGTVVSMVHRPFRTPLSQIVFCRSASFLCFPDRRAASFLCFPDFRAASFLCFPDCRADVFRFSNGIPICLFNSAAAPPTLKT